MMFLFHFLSRITKITIGNKQRAPHCLRCHGDTDSFGKKDHMLFSTTTNPEPETIKSVKIPLWLENRDCVCLVNHSNTIGIRFP